MAMTAAQRKEKERNGYRAQGLVPVYEVWVRPENVEKLRKTEMKLREERK